MQNTPLSKPKKYSFFNGQNTLQFLLILFLALVIVLPLIRMFFYIDGETFISVVKKPQFLPALKNSLVSTTISTAISVLIAYALAYISARIDIKLKWLFKTVFILPMLIPSISQALGLIALFGNNGFFTNLLGLKTSIYGIKGIIIGSVLYSFPVAYLMIEDILKYEDYSPYEAADVLGISKSRQALKISLPYLKKPLISVVFATFTLIITDYGVPLSIGNTYKTLPVILYEEAVDSLNYSTGSVIGIFLLVPAVIAFILDLINKESAKTTYTTNPFVEKDGKASKIFGYVFCFLIGIFVLSIVFAFCLQAFAKAYPRDMTFTFNNFEKAFDKDILTYLLNSVVMSVLSATVGVTVSFLTSYYSARIKNKCSKIMHLMSIISLAIPGLVLGLSYVIVFNKTFLYGTLTILILVNSVHFFASPYLMSYNALSKMNENLESVGEVLGISKFRMVINVIIPQLKSTLTEMFSYFFVNSMITISAVSFLSAYDTKPLSLMIDNFEQFNMIECAAVVAIVILAVNVLFKIVVSLLKKKFDKNKEGKK